jgi:superfamily II DNA helicase RecQ
VTEAHKAGRKLAVEIKECKRWGIVCIDPEHLRDSEWWEITEWPVFRSNVIFGCVDEAHLIKEWGRLFQLAFRHIGAFFRGRLPPKTSVVALSATLQPGSDTDCVTASLGMVQDVFTLLRRSNERLNTQFIIEVLEHGLGGNDFTCLLPYITSGRKTIIHCRTIDMVFRGYVWAWHMQSMDADKLRRIQMYHALRDPEDNEETIRLLEEDPHCQLVFATVAFANGLNVKSLIDSLSLGFGETVNQVWQEKGHVGQVKLTPSRGVIFVQPSVFAVAEKQIEGTCPLAAAPTIINCIEQHIRQIPRLHLWCDSIRRNPLNSWNWQRPNSLWRLCATFRA